MKCFLTARLGFFAVFRLDYSNSLFADLPAPFLQILQEQNTMRKKFHLREKDVWCSCSVISILSCSHLKIAFVLLIQVSDIPE